MALGQQPNSPIERARLFQTTPGVTNPAVNADGMALSQEESDESSDDSFGKQVILKKRERLRTVLVSADVSLFYTNNAALTPNHKIDDAFAVANVGISWTPRINPHLEAQISGRASIFRYHRTSALDFENFTLGGALFWAPEHFNDITLFARYDLVELLDRHSREILRDHVFSVGAQRIFRVGSSQTFTLGVAASAGIADPASAQRQQASIFASYRWEITRAFDAEVSGRLAGYYYNHADRMDGNLVAAANLRYRLSRFSDLSAFVSLVSNQSDTAGFDYNAFTAGAGIALAFRF